jgi:DNA topoisomerase VI subunit A
MAASRTTAEHEILTLARDSLLRIVRSHGTHVANVSLLVRQRGMCDDHGALKESTAVAVLGGASTITARRQLAQLWAVLAEVHATLAAGGKCTQRELWYRLKTTGIFPGPPTVNERVLDACAAVSCRCGAVVRRETLGVIAAPRGSMSGCITLLPPEGSNAPAQPLAESVFQVPVSGARWRAPRVARIATTARPPLPPTLPPPALCLPPPSWR